MESKIFQVTAMRRGHVKTTALLSSANALMFYLAITFNASSLKKGINYLRKALRMTNQIISALALLAEEV